MMKEVILLLTVLVMFIVCFFVMGKIGYFINENYKAFIIEERKNTFFCFLVRVCLRCSASTALAGAGTILWPKPTPAGA